MEDEIQMSYCPLCEKTFEVCDVCGAMVGHGCPESERIPCIEDEENKKKEKEPNDR